jgi:hypothetical protein
MGQIHSRICLQALSFLTGSGNQLWGFCLYLPPTAVLTQFQLLLNLTQVILTGYPLMSTLLLLWEIES